MAHGVEEETRKEEEEETPMMTGMKDQENDWARWGQFALTLMIGWLFACEYSTKLGKHVATANLTSSN